MFKRLRDKFVVSVATMTAIVISLAFAVIFVAVQRAKTVEPVALVNVHGEVVTTSCQDQLIDDRNRNLDRLLELTVITGICMEAVICWVGYKWSSKAIQPVKDVYDGQKMFVANASHELKTPLAAIQANLEALSDSLDEDDAAWADNIERELEKANRLVGDMLDLARLEQGKQPTSEKKKLEVSTVLREEALSFKPRLNGRKLKLSIAKNISLDAYDGDFMRVVDILLDNAMKYAESWVRVELRAGSLCVSNDGEKITKMNLKRVFERFYQVDKSKPGSGMGLAIAKMVAERNGWKLSAESSEEATSFKLTWR